MVTRDLVRHAKPDPDLFLAAAALLGVEPRHAIGQLREVADVVTFLLSERASWVTGANIAVDGGRRYPGARRFD